MAALIERCVAQAKAAVTSRVWLLYQDADWGE